MPEYDNAKWERENDARTMAEAEAIKMDKKRLAGARKEAKKMAVDKMREAQGMKKVAGLAPRRKATKRSGQRVTKRSARVRR